jgi:hypothetical protein
MNEPVYDQNGNLTSVELIPATPVVPLQMRPERLPWRVAGPLIVVGSLVCWYLIWKIVAAMLRAVA